ncbi:MAG: hypothetical protein NFCOHLIN_02603 [Gammaproteobacteria bacterium]|nr:hypothetical protein [Gammaproteobacteria bacterium]
MRVSRQSLFVPIDKRRYLAQNAFGKRLPAIPERLRAQYRDGTGTHS